MPRSSVLLVAHGSRDPRAASTARALARTVAALRPGLDVRVAFLELSRPAPAEVLAAMPAGTVVVPLLLTLAYHGAIDLPAQVAGFDCVITGTLGSVSEPLLEALTRRLPPGDFDGLVLAAAGTRVESARRTVRDVAAALGERLGLPWRVAYAAGADGSSGSAARGRDEPLSGAEAVAALRNEGARRVAVASYFLASGRLYDTVTRAALDAGAVAIAPPLGASWRIAELVMSQVDRNTGACEATRGIAA